MENKSKNKLEEDVIYHKDGSLWGKGVELGGKKGWYWEWFRIDGSKMRSGYFLDSKQVGDWTTYDKDGGVVKVTNFDKKVPK